MITVRLAGNALTVCGHAGYAPPGLDIICAAVSTVVVLCEASLEAFGCVWAETDDGQTVTVRAAGREAATILGAAVKILRRLAAQYPAHVQVSCGADGGAAERPDLIG